MDMVVYNTFYFKYLAHCALEASGVVWSLDISLDLCLNAPPHLTSPHVSDVQTRAGGFIKSQITGSPPTGPDLMEPGGPGEMRF